MNKHILYYLLRFLLINHLFLIFCHSYLLKAESRIDFDRQYILLIDFNYINCPMCLDAISTILDYLKKENPETIMGIVVCNGSFKMSEKNMKILKKQIEGFKIGNNISFPIYLDLNGCFDFVKKFEVSLIELDRRNKSIRKIESFVTNGH